MPGYNPNEGGGAIPRQSIGSLAAPGLAAPTRAYSANAEMVQQALASLGHGAQVFQQATSLYAHDRALAAREKAVQDQIIKGQAAQDWAIQRAAVKSKIDAGDFSVADPESADELKATHAAIAAGFADGKGEDYAKHYLALSGGDTAAWLAGAAKDRQDRQRANDTYDVEQSMRASVDPEEIVKSLDTIGRLNPHWTEDQRMIPLYKMGEEAAASGDADKVFAAMQVMGNRRPDLAAKWEGQLRTQAAQKQAAGIQQVQDQVAGFLNEGQPMPAKAFLDNAVKQGQINPEAARHLYAQITAEDGRRTKAAEDDALQGYKDLVAAGADPKQVDEHFRLNAELWGPDWRDRAAREGQEVHANNIARDIGLGRFLPGPDGRPDVQATMAGVVADMDRPANDPRHLTAAQGLSILKQTEKRLDFDAQGAVVMQRLTSPTGSGGVPLGEKQDAALTNALGANFGVLAGVPDKEGKFIPTAITAPNKLAGLADKAGRVPKDVSGLIQRGMAGDANEIAQAAQSLAALQAQNPILAEQVIADMAPVAQMRARELQSRVDMGAYVAPGSDDAGLLQQGRATNARLFQDLAGMKYAPVPEADLKLAMYGKDAREQAAAKDKILKEAFTVPEHEWLRISDYKPSLNTAQRGEFFNLLEQEYQTALARTGSDAQALGIAKAKAATRFAMGHQQIVWNGQAITTDAPRQMGDPNAFRDAVEKELRDAGWKNEASIKDVLNSTYPVWDKTNRAWRFKDQLGNDYTYDTPTEAGKVLAISLIPADGAKYTPEKVQQLKDRVEAEKKRKQMDDLYNDG